MNDNSKKKAPVLSVKNLSHQYSNAATLFDGVCFELYSSEKVALVGANGQGKTTLFHILVGLITKQQGEILAMGRSIHNEKDFIELRQQVGLVFQDPDDQLFCPSVLDDVMFGPLNQGHDLPTAKRLAAQMLEKLNLSHLQERMATQLSGGEKRMVTLASVLVMQPKVLLLDEPTNALDNASKAQLLDLLKSLEQAMIVISHDQAFLDELTTNTLILESGMLRVDNT